MCLESLCYSEDLEIPKQGYKVFINDEKCLLSLYHCRKFRKRRWESDYSNKDYIESYNGDQYQTGFHCFLTKEDAIDYSKSRFMYDSTELTIHRVLLKGVVAIGEHYTCDNMLADAVVSKQIYIMEEVKE
jgi:hypothetical protein